MTIAEKLKVIDENVDKVFEAGKAQSGGGGYDEGFEAGKQAEISELWESRRKSIGTTWLYAFAGKSWNDETFGSIPFDISNINGSALSLFSYSSITNLKQILENNKVTLDVSTATNCNTLFFYSTITHLPKVDLSSATTTTSAFAYMRQLVYFEEVVFSSKTDIKDTLFQWCDKLTHLRIGGGIYKNGLNFQWSPLDHDSLMSIINTLEDKSSDTSGTVWKVTIGATNYAKLTTEEINIADRKGWVLE